MGAAAVASGSTPPPFDLGALFGLGVKPGADMEKGMRWEGPMKPGSQPDGTFWSTKRLKLSRRTREKDERIAKFLEIPEDPIEKSRTGFEALLALRKDSKIIQSAELEPILSYLQSPQNEPDARLTERLLDWLLERPATEDCLPALVDVIERKLALDTVSCVEIGSILQKLRSHGVITKHFVTIAECLPREWALKILSGMTKQILEAHTESELKVQTRDWLTCLRSCSSVPGFRYFNHEGWIAIYQELARVCRPSDLADHFSRLPRIDVSRILLSHWVQKLAHPQSEEMPAFMDSQTVRSLRFRPSNAEMPDHAVLAADLKHLHGLPWTPSPTPTYRKSPLIDLVEVLAQHRLPYETILGEIISIYSETEPAAKLRNIFMDLIRRPSVAKPTPFATKLVNSFLASGEVDYARQIFNLVPSISLSECFDLPLQLIEKNKLTSNDLFAILNRLTASDTIDPDKRDVHTLALTQEHVDLVHLVAYTFAKCQRITPREAFRRVWQCYRFLRDRQAPLDPLMSRALVKAGISRYFAHGIRPSASQTSYILNIVTDLEGIEMARRLDENVFVLGRKVQAGHRGSPGSRWEMAQATRDRSDERLMEGMKWRLKGWTTGRGRSLWRARMKDGAAATTRTTADPFCTAKVAADPVNLVTEREERGKGVAVGGEDAASPRSYKPFL